MLYTNPNDVRSPIQNISDVTVLFNGEMGDNPFSVAKVNWDGEERLAMRWNISHKEWSDPDKISEKRTCIGNPQSRGYPTWFIIPEAFFDPKSPIVEVMKNLVN